MRHTASRLAFENHPHSPRYSPAGRRRSVVPDGVTRRCPQYLFPALPGRSGRPTSFVHLQGRGPRSLRLSPEHLPPSSTFEDPRDAIEPTCTVHGHLHMERSVTSDLLPPELSLVVKGGSHRCQRSARDHLRVGVVFPTTPYEHLPFLHGREKLISNKLVIKKKPLL